MKIRTRFRHDRESFLKDESGAVMVIAAFALIIILTVTSLVTDLGLRYYQKSRLQNAMDAAALASVTSLPDKARARVIALDYVQKNGFSTDSVVIEFPQDGVIRVRDTFECQTLFSGLFSGDKMRIEAHAAAKYLQKNMSIDFDYLMFHGAESTFNLNGDFREVAGAIFGNGNIRVTTNDAAIIQTIVSARQVGFYNNMSHHPDVVEHAAKQAMPDWDEMIMSIAPVAEEEQFTAEHTHLSPNASYLYVYNGDTNLQNIISYSPGSVICHGSLSTGYNSTAFMYVRGNLYVDGDFKPQCPVYVTGDLYVGGDLNPAWGMSVTVNGNAYVGGSASFSAGATIGGELYTGGDLTLRNGSGTYSFGKVHCMGDFSSTTAWGAQVTVKSTTSVYGKLTLGGGGRNILKDDVFVWGNGYNNNDEVMLLNGYLNLRGDVWCGRGKVAFGGNGDCDIHGFVYSLGSIETRSGGDISLNGCMIAEGNIAIGGASHTYNDDGATLSLYSRNGNVTLGSQGSALNMWGIVYAPKGDIKISTDGLHIYGSLVANTITCNIGSGFYIGKNDRTLPFAKTIRSAALVE